MLLERTAAQSIKCNSGSIAKRCAKIIYSLPLVKEEMIDSDGGSVELIRHKYAKHKADSFLGLAQLIDSEEDLAVETFQRMSQQAVPIDIDLRFSERMLPIDKDLVVNFLHGCKQQFSTRLEDYQMLKNLEPKENGYVVWAKRQNLSTESITQYISKPIVEKIRSLDNLINSVN